MILCSHNMVYYVSFIGIKKRMNQTKRKKKEKQNKTKNEKKKERKKSQQKTAPNISLIFTNQAQTGVAIAYSFHE